MYLPTTIEELDRLGWVKPDIILVSGDTYIDSPYDGVAALGKFLLSKGFKVAVIAQPDVSNQSNLLNSVPDIARLGEPSLFWGVSAGCVDSMVANYTALNKKKRSDDLTPGNINNRRPNRATIVYCNEIRRYFKNTKPIILGGIEASLRRIAHYDYWSDSVRRSILFDAKADYLVYGEGEHTILEVAEKLRDNKSLYEQKGLCYISNTPIPNYIDIPSFEEVAKDKKAFNVMFTEFYKNNDPKNAKGLFQKNGERFLVQNPPNDYIEGKDLDALFDLGYEYDVHPFYKSQGKIKALETISFSIISHRGCYGECNFCSITVHQGRKVRSRSEESILKEAEYFTKNRNFKGIIKDIGGATANMYGNVCAVQNKSGSCKNKRCVFPVLCKKMDINHNELITVLQKLAALPGVKKVITGSGIRYDLVVADKANGRRYLEDVIEKHLSGQMKIAPEHTDEEVLSIMGKPQVASLKQFKEEFFRITKKYGKKQFLTYYIIAAHPGCHEKNMKNLSDYMHKELNINPEQVQVFTPTPSTYSTAMYFTGINPLTGKEVFSEKSFKKKNIQKQIVVGKK